MILFIDLLIFVKTKHFLNTGPHSRDGMLDLQTQATGYFEVFS